MSERDYYYCFNSDASIIIIGHLGLLRPNSDATIIIISIGVIGASWNPIAMQQ